MAGALSRTIPIRWAPVPPKGEDRDKQGHDDTKCITYSGTPSR